MDTRLADRRRATLPLSPTLGDSCVNDTTDVGSEETVIHLSLQSWEQRVELIDFKQR